IDAAILVMRSGGSTAAANRALSNVLKGYGKEEVSVVWRLDFVSLTVDSAALVRAVGPVGVNLSRVSETLALAERLGAGNLSASDFPAALERVRKLGSTHNRWIIIAAAGGAAASFSRITGGDWGSFGIVL